VDKTSLDGQAGGDFEELARKNSKGSETQGKSSSFRVLPQMQVDSEMMPRKQSSNRTLLSMPPSDLEVQRIPTFGIDMAEGHANLDLFMLGNAGKPPSNESSDPNHSKEKQD
jgi:hypothetical protein